MYPYQGQWHVATSGTPDASGHINGGDLTFAEYFWNTYNNSGFKLPEIESLQDPHSFYFELTGPLNRVVVVYPEPGLTLLGARNLTTQQELSVEEAAKLFSGEVPIIKSFSLQSINDIITSFDTMSPLSQEGYVVVDGNFNRIKVKHPGYVALHHAKDGMNEKAFIEIARKGEISEVITAFPEFEPLLLKSREKVEAFTRDIDEAFSKIKHIENQKEFAGEALKTVCSSAMFSLRQGKLKTLVNDQKVDIALKSAKDYVQHIRIDSLQEYLEKY